MIGSSQAIPLDIKAINFDYSQNKGFYNHFAKKS